MKKSIILILFLVSINIFSQQGNLDFDINKSTLSEYIQNEKNFVGGEIIDKTTIDLFDELKHISFIRSDGNIPDIDLIVRYIYFEKDSLILEIRHEWDIANHNKKLNNKMDLNFRKSMLSFYSKLENSNKSSFGKSEIEGKLPKRINENDDYCKINRWKLKNIEIKLEIKMSNSYDKEKNIFPTHKIILSYRTSNLKNRTDYNDKTLLKHERKEIPNIEHPIIGNSEPVYPNCENSKRQKDCMYGNIQELIINKIKSKGMFIKNDTLKIGFLIDINGKTNPWKYSIKSKNKELEKITFDILLNLPKMKPAYSKETNRNFPSGHTFYLIIKNNEILNKFRKE